MAKYFVNKEIAYPLALIIIEVIFAKNMDVVAGKRSYYVFVYLVEFFGKLDNFLLNLRHQ